MIFFKVYDFMSKNIKSANIHHKILLISMLILVICLSGCFGFKPSPLNQAAWDNDVIKIKALIDSGAFVDEVAPCPRRIFKVFASSPLDLAVLQGNLEAVKALLDAGADVNLSRYCHAIISSPEKYPRTPSQGYYGFKGSALMLSSLVGNLQISKLLLESGADPNQLTEKGLWQFSELNEFDALSFSGELGNSEITKLLLKHGADPNRRYKNGSKSAYRALQRGRIGYVVTLLEENALEIESNSIYGNFNVEFAELAHIAADYYASSNEKKAIRLYKQAIKFYPEAIKSFEWHYKFDSEKWLSGCPKKLRFFISKTSSIKVTGHFFYTSTITPVSRKIPFKIIVFYTKDSATSFTRTHTSFTEDEQVVANLNLRPFIKESEFFHSYDLSSDDPINNSYIKYENEAGKDLVDYYIEKVKHSKQSLNLIKTILNYYEENKPDIALIDCVKSALGNKKLHKGITKKSSGRKKTRR